MGCSLWWGVSVSVLLDGWQFYREVGCSYFYFLKISKVSFELGDEAPRKPLQPNGSSRLSGVKPVAVDYTSTPITGTISKVLIAIDKTLPI